MKHLLVTRGVHGVLLASAEVAANGGDGDAAANAVFEATYTVQHVPAVPGLEVVDCTGAGDTLVGAFAWAYVHRPAWPVERCVRFAAAGAARSVCSGQAVPSAELAELVRSSSEGLR